MPDISEDADTAAREQLDMLRQALLAAERGLAAAIWEIEKLAAYDSPLAEGAEFNLEIARSALAEVRATLGR